MEWIKRKSGTIEQIVTEQTKMSAKQLLDDKHVYQYPKIIEAVNLFHEHLKRGSKIAIYGDYDADGITSLTEFNLTIKAFKFVNVKLFAPRRFSDGYGINKQRIQQFIDEKYDLILTVDNGIAAIEEVQLAKNAGLDVIILDHHIPTKGIPDADVVCDPHVTGGDDTYNFDDLCGAGLTLHFLLEFMKRFNHVSDEEKMILTSKLYSIAAIGTIADLVDLTFDNRAIVKRGLKEINEARGTVGLNSLLEALGIQSVDSTAIAFGLAPAINAPGRLYDDGAKKMVELLSFDQNCTALEEMCEEAKKTNKLRKEKTNNALDEAILSLKDVVTPETTMVVFKDSSKMPGIAGLIASKLVELYRRPAIVVTESTDPEGNVILKGSGRNFGDIDILDAVTKSADHLIKFGGHKEALGLALKPENFNAFCKAVNAATPKCVVPDELYYDIKMGPTKGLWGIVKELEKFEPFGTGNEKPVICIDNVVLGDKFGNTTRYMGENNEHIKLLAENVSILKFNDGAEIYNELGKPDKVSAIGDLSINVFNGRRSLQLQAIDIKAV